MVYFNKQTKRKNNERVKGILKWQTTQKTGATDRVSAPENRQNAMQSG
jgi:hypothetical protein